ncbi:MAG: ABC transporter ATP-binding protein [Caldilineae bacterium]|nr:MAG: ABC transporter ATP-binding protein [Caldilineae bacterium]
MADLIVIDNLTKIYKTRKAVDGISFAIPEGAIFGFIGPNGAGKTTTIRILTTLLQPSEGRILVGGHDVLRDREIVRRRLGYIPDFFGLYNDMTVWEYLDFFAGCYQIPHAERPPLINDLLALVDLQHRRDDFVNGLSRGLKQRLGLARALIHDPQILVLDEPAAGLDPRARVEFRALLKELQAMGKTIFFSSHILSDVDELCTDVGIIEAGRMVTWGNLKAMRAQLQTHHTIHITLLGDALDAAKLALSYVPQVSALSEHPTPDGDWELELSFTGSKEDVSALLKRLVSAGIPLLSFTQETQTLEEMFMQVTKGIVS